MFGSWLGGLLGISALGGLSAWSHHGLVVAPFGASTVLLFGHRHRPLGHGAVALLGVLLRARVSFIVMPVLIGSLPLTAMAVVFSRLKGDANPYPHHWL